MSMFFPRGLELNDTQSPMEILQEAQRDWEKESGKMLGLVLQPAKSQSGNDMIIVHAEHLPSPRTTTLFTVVYRPGKPYPVTIQPKDDELPNFLKKSYYRTPAAFASATAAILGMQRTVQGETVENKWVAETPSEFRSKLQQVFNLGWVKSEILSLLSGSPEAGTEAPDISEPQDEKE